MFQTGKVAMAVMVSVIVHVVSLLLFFGSTSNIEKTTTNAETLKTNYTAPVSRENAYLKHADDLKAKLKGRGFTVLIQTPFVVIGDEPEARVKQRAENTVKWAVDKLKQDYFTKDPTDVLEIWLFKDDTSYRKHAKEFFNDEPDTPYGYYSPSSKALVMNISTGGGTLVHEIVHPFMEANFPDVPAWFNEGMGSLYEQSGEEAGHIHGYTNWRLPGLQKGIKNKTVPTFKKLLAMTDTEFYREDTGTNYAQSRYLLYYLQQKKLLVRFYKEFLANRTKDPTGYQTLQTVLGTRDMITFQKNWEAFVLKLRVGYEVDVS